MPQRLTADISLEQLGGRTLRVARWRMDRASAHPPLLFFNGIGANIEAIAPLAEALTERPFIMFDMPGTGGSPDPVVPYNAVTMSLCANELLIRDDIAQVDVMGVSWGGAMAQHFALQHRGKVRRLVLAATTPGMLMVPGKLSALSKMADPRRYVDAAFMERHFKTLYGGAVDGADELGAGHIGRITPPSKRGYLYQLLAMIGWTSLPALPFLRQETLIMMGGDDAIVPVINGRLLKALIPNARLEVFEGGGHLFMLSHREQTLSSLRAFLDEPETARKAA